MIELLLYLLLAKDNDNIFPTLTTHWLFHRLKFKTLLTSRPAMSTGTPTIIYAPAPIEPFVELSATLTN
jgi:hypothetical protein